MNERIRQLADEAGLSEGVFTRHDGVPCDLKGYSMLPDEMQKFANLIVCECVKVMYDNAIERNVPPDISQTPTHYAVAVLEHFGVEL